MGIQDTARARVCEPPSSIPGEKSHVLLITAASCSLRQATSGPQRELGKDANLQTLICRLFICRPSSIWRGLPPWAPQIAAVLRALWAETCVHPQHSVLSPSPEELPSKPGGKEARCFAAGTAMPCVSLL